MLSKLSINMLKLYQKVPGPWHKMCRYTPSCSEYAIESIDKYGFVKGWIKALKRVLRCNPLGKSGYDPVD